MSLAEIVNKRGRPRKVVTDPVKVEVPDGVNSATTRAKSTKAASASAKKAKAAPAKAPVARKSVASSAAAAAAAAKKAVSASSAKPVPVEAKVAVPVKPVQSPKEKSGSAAPGRKPDTVQSSKILREVQALQAERASTPADGKDAAQKVRREPSRPSLTTTTTVASRPSIENAQPKTALLNATHNANHMRSAPVRPPPPMPPPSAPKPHVPVAELNSAIVSKISTRAGARPTTSGSQQLPKNYKQVARKVTAVMVALPILLVTSYMLYKRCKYPPPPPLHGCRGYRMNADVENSGYGREAEVAGASTASFGRREES